MQGKNKALFMLNHGGNYAPLSLGNPSNALEVIPADLKFWYVQEQREAISAYQFKNLLMQALPMIAFVICMVIIFLIFIFLFKRVDAMMDMASAKAIERACAQPIA